MCARISSVRDLKGLAWAKGRLRSKIVEVLETGKMEKLEAKKSNPRLRSLVEMARIWGVGRATAAKLYKCVRSVRVYLWVGEWLERWMLTFEPMSSCGLSTAWASRHWTTCGRLAHRFSRPSSRLG